MTAGEGYGALRAADDIGTEWAVGDSTIAGLTLGGLRPVRLLLHRLGPFRGLAPTAIQFVAPDPTTARATLLPCDVLVVCGDNGTGKSSLLDALHGLFGLLSCRPTGIFSRLDDANARRTPPAMLPSVRLDLLAVCTIDGHARRVFMTLWHGGDQPPVAEGDADALERMTDGRERVLIGFSCGSRMAADTNEAGRRILAAVRAAEGCALFDPLSARGVGTQFAPFPTAMLFRHGQSEMGRSTSSSAGGGIVYEPAKRFDLEEIAIGQTASRLSQLKHAHLRHLLEELGDSIFLEEHATSGLTLVPNRGFRVDRGARRLHRLENLGSGETALLAVQANGWLHMTASALLLIDDLDGRIARRWHEKASVTTLRLAMGRAGAMLVLTTRDARFAATIVSAAAELGLTCGRTSLSSDPD